MNAPAKKKKRESPMAFDEFLLRIRGTLGDDVCDHIEERYEEVRKGDRGEDEEE